jgi:beta-glucanase (GH16 family)
LQYYTDNNQNIEISQGMLTIHTRKEFKFNKQYTSARLLSKRKFRYGIFEMRAKLPYGRGTWPAFWLLAANRPLNWPRDGEIDIMEHLGFEMNVVHATIHCQNFNHMIGTQIGKSTKVNDVSNQFHLYQLYWSNNKIEVYVDNKLFYTYTKPANANYDSWPFDNEFNIILNTAVGGNWGGVKGIDDSIFPQKYIIDYVKIYGTR